MVSFRKGSFLAGSLPEGEVGSFLADGLVVVLALILRLRRGAACVDADG